MTTVFAPCKYCVTFPACISLVTDVVLTAFYTIITQPQHACNIAMLLLHGMNSYKADLHVHSSHSNKPTYAGTSYSGTEFAPVGA